MSRLAVALATGALFGIGLLVSGMTDTRKVQGFLDVTGAWDPTLAFVMGGALLPMAWAWRRARSTQPTFATSFPPPSSAGITRRLAVGAVLFGAGWGLVGLCPGPALASLAFGGWNGAIFILAMAAAMVAQGRARRPVPVQ